MEAIKTIHVVCALLSFAGFFIRGIWMLRDSTLLKQRWVKISPQVIDTLMLVSAIILAVRWPGPSDWWVAKTIALVVYIGFGLVALRLGRTKGIRLVAWLLGMTTFTYILVVAATKSPMGWLAFV